MDPLTGQIVPLLAHYLPSSRVAHSQRVADTARRLASQAVLEAEQAPALVEQAYLAGLLHDIAKAMSPDSCRAAGLTSDLWYEDLYAQYPAVWHAFAAPRMIHSLALSHFSAKPRKKVDIERAAPFQSPCSSIEGVRTTATHSPKMGFERAKAFESPSDYMVSCDTIGGLGAIATHSPKMGFERAKPFQILYQAIRYHTTGRVHMSCLDAILYIADYIEPERPFADRAAIVGLFEDKTTLPTLTFKEKCTLAVTIITTGSILSLSKKQKPIHPLTLRCYNARSAILSGVSRQYWRTHCLAYYPGFPPLKFYS